MPIQCKRDESSAKAMCLLHCSNDVIRVMHVSHVTCIIHNTRPRSRHDETDLAKDLASCKVSNQAPDSIRICRHSLYTLHKRIPISTTWCKTTRCKKYKVQPQHVSQRVGTPFNNTQVPRVICCFTTLPPGLPPPSPLKLCGTFIVASWSPDIHMFMSEELP